VILLPARLPIQDIGKKIKEGKVGGLFNIKSVEKISAVQKVAVEESRLKIPMIFGMDVIHGYETVFPIPLGLVVHLGYETGGTQCKDCSY
jgi:beta-glucosidase-like glycosyl hydrolase